MNPVEESFRVALNNVMQQEKESFMQTPAGKKLLVVAEYKNALMPCCLFLRDINPLVVELPLVGLCTVGFMVNLPPHVQFKVLLTCAVAGLLFHVLRSLSPLFIDILTQDRIQTVRSQIEVGVKEHLTSKKDDLITKARGESQSNDQLEQRVFTGLLKTSVNGEGYYLV